MPPHQRCLLLVCSVCDSYEGNLTTDCPGVRVDRDRQQEVYETNLDYIDARGWHQGKPVKLRSPNFGLVTPVALTCLQNELTRKAIAWARADRVADDHAAAVTLIEEKIQGARPLPEELELAKIDFHFANQRADECDDELRQVARVIAEILDRGEGDR